MNQKVLIIKLGYSETLHSEVTEITSLGDVFRHTVLLNLYQNDRVTWLTSKKAAPLLQDNPHVERILIFDLMTVLQLQAEQFDIVINLEKVPGLCALADSIRAWQKYGFRYNAVTGTIDAYKGASHVLNLSADNNLKKNVNNRTLQDLLFDLVGATWNGEGYVLGYKPRTQETIDVGLNTEVGAKWPSKKWSMEHWTQLEHLLKAAGYTVSWQKGLNNLFEYMDWVNSSRLLVTSDSLGLHLSLAMKKKVIALFGSTYSREIHMYGCGRMIRPGVARPCIPCMNPRCEYEVNCVDTILPQQVFDEVAQMLGARNGAEVRHG